MCTLLVRRFGKRLRLAGWTASLGGISGFGGWRENWPSGSGTGTGRGHVRDVYEARELREGRSRTVEFDED